MNNAKKSCNARDLFFIFFLFFHNLEYFYEMTTVFFGIFYCITNIYKTIVFSKTLQVSLYSSVIL